jgi:unspecific monooxygenase
VYTISRACVQATDIGGYRVPRRGYAMVASHLMHYDERWFPQPHEFRPERFAGAKEAPQFAYLPFGGGKRVCIGARWAVLQSVAALAALLQTCRLSLPADHQPPRLDCKVVLQPEGELVVLSHPRESTQSNGALAPSRRIVTTAPEAV